jgi:hypothetical protein
MLIAARPKVELSIGRWSGRNSFNYTESSSVNSKCIGGNLAGIFESFWGQFSNLPNIKRHRATYTRSNELSLEVPLL